MRAPLAVSIEWSILKSIVPGRATREPALVNSAYRALDASRHLVPACSDEHPRIRNPRVVLPSRDNGVPHTLYFVKYIVGTNSAEPPGGWTTGSDQVAAERGLEAWSRRGAVDRYSRIREEAASSSAQDLRASVASALSVIP